MLSSQRQRMSNKSPVHFSRPQLSPTSPSASDYGGIHLPGAARLWKAPSISLSCWLINTNGQLSSLHKATAIAGINGGLITLFVQAQCVYSLQQPTFWTLIAHYQLHHWRNKTRLSAAPLQAFPRKSLNLRNATPGFLCRGF